MTGQHELFTAPLHYLQNDKKCVGSSTHRSHDRPTNASDKATQHRREKTDELTNVSGPIDKGQFI